MRDDTILVQPLPSNLSERWLSVVPSGWQWIGGSGGDDDQYGGPPGTSQEALQALRGVLREEGVEDWPMATSYDDFVQIY